MSESVPLETLKASWESYLEDVVRTKLPGLQAAFRDAFYAGALSLHGITVHAALTGDTQKAIVVVAQELEDYIDELHLRAAANGSSIQ
jgi:hypothetical protein